MTVSSTTSLNTYLGTGAVSTYAYTFQIHNENELRVTKQDEAGTLTTLARVLDYTVAGEGEVTGGTITLTAGNLPTGQRLAISRSMDFLQQTSLPEGSRFQGATVERVFDRLCMMVQQLLGITNRSVKVRETEAGGFDGTLPTILPETVLGINPTGTGFRLYPLISTGGGTGGSGGAGVGMISVKDYGAKGDGVNNDTSAFAAAWAAASAISSPVYLPPGNYRITSTLNLTSPYGCGFIGAGHGASRIFIDQTGGHGLVVTVTDAGVFKDFDVHGAARPTGLALLKIVNSFRPCIGDITLLAGDGELLQLENVQLLSMSRVFGQSSSGDFGGTCLRIKNASGHISATNMRTGNSMASDYSGSQPCVYVTGMCTNLNFTGCTFSGGGPLKTVSIVNITSDPVRFTVNTAVSHGYSTGDIAVIRGANLAPYNNQWRVASAPSATSFTVEITNNHGTSAGGTVQDPAACVLIQSDNGPINESSFVNCLFEGLRPQLWGSASVVLDGRVQQAGGSYNQVTGWRFTGCYFDFGMTGLMALGQYDASTRPSVTGVTVSGSTFLACRGVHLDRASGFQVTGCCFESPANALINDGLGEGAALHIWKTRSVTFTGNRVGPRDGFVDAPKPFVYGVVFDGRLAAAAPAFADPIREVSIVANIIHGSTVPVLLQSSPLPPQAQVRIVSNLMEAGAGRVASPVIAAGTNMDVPPGYDIVRVTGFATVTTMTPVWEGREVKLAFAAGMNFNTGGNVAAPGYAFGVGTVGTCVYTNGLWYIR